MINPPEDRVDLLPWRAWRAELSRTTLRLDAQAGLTVALFAVPQAMAYALMAGLPPVHGLYAAVAMSFVAALWGASPYVNAGPTNSAALLAVAAIAPFALQSPEQAVPLIATFALLVGLIRLVMGLLRLGWLMQLVPEAAILGFSVAAGTLIALEQSHQLLGVAASRQSNFGLRMIEVWSQAPQANLMAVLVAVSTCTLMLLFDRFSRRFPVALIVILLTSFAAYVLQRAGAPAVNLVRNIAPIPTGLPGLQIPILDLNLLVALWPAAAAAAVIGLIEAVSIGQTLALKHRTSLNFNQEFFGQGLGQIAGALVGGPPGSGSFSRSALIEGSGGQTRWANICFSIFTGIALLALPRGLELIPLSALAGLLLFTGLKLVNIRAVRNVWRTSRGDTGVVAITFLVTVFWRIEYGFFAGLVAALVLFVARSRDLQIFELIPLIRSPSEPVRFLERGYKPGSQHERSDVVALALHGDLYFGLAQELREQLGEIARVQQPRFIVVRTRRAHSIDYGCWQAIFDFARAFQANGGRLYLCGVRKELSQIIAESDIRGILPPEQVVEVADSPWASFEEGMKRVAAQLSPDATLSPQWSLYMERLQFGQSVSHWKDPLNDPATLGVVPDFN